MTTVARPAFAVKELVFDDMPARDDAALLLLQFSVLQEEVPATDPTALEKTWRFHSSDASTVQRSRREIMTYLRGMAADPDELFTGEVILSEILANTVEHAPGLVEVHIDWIGGNPILTVRDAGRGLRDNGSLPDNPLDENGRGVFLIGNLADEAFVNPSPGCGTELRAVLPIQRRDGVGRADR